MSIRKLCLNGDSEYIRPSRLLLDRKKFTIGGIDAKSVTLLNIFNIGASYLNFGPQWVIDQLKDLEMLQLGRWQDSPLHHIEVGSQEFLRELRALKNLKYLSLRGISKIFELPSSITELESLLILDLKASHNLERLPDDISSMKSLRKLHLECFPGKSFLDCFTPSKKLPRELNITGGKLESIDIDRIEWNLEILRLKHLKQLNVDIDHLKKFHPWLKYVEIKQISNHSYIEHEYEGAKSVFEKADLPGQRKGRAGEEIHLEIYPMQGTSSTNLMERKPFMVH
ncbi:uncharacterized protein HKW66_Vig0112710 [Vigna angularis]|uniref:Uncharacterized protein n=1 Tax=Phaseolus angularis TaxID=3914 RepID=A0A8T0KY61_PHAAN|nr:uncharacterized protein HKW66_Vig0112710 [Vigna angularis]